MGRATLVLLAALGATLTGCEDHLAHTFSAYRYNVLKDCLEPGGVIDVVDGPSTGVCHEARCWYSPSDEIFVTTTACSTSPEYVEHTDDPEGSPCFLALAAEERKEFGRCPASGDDEEADQGP